MSYPWNQDDTSAPPCYVRAWRDLDLSRRPHLCSAATEPSYVSSLRANASCAPVPNPPVDLSPETIARGRANSLKKRQQRAKP